VNLLMFEGAYYLVSARGTGDWVRNVQAAGELDLVVGRRRAHYRSEEMIDADKNPVLRSYLKRWKAEVGVFFDGVDAGSSDSELQPSLRNTRFSVWSRPISDASSRCCTSRRALPAPDAHVVPEPGPEPTPAAAPRSGPPPVSRGGARAAEIVAAARRILEEEGPERSR